MVRFTVLSVVGFGLWTARPAASQDVVERLTLLGPDKQVIATIEGGRSRVVIDPAIDGQLLRPGARISLVHNHPNGVGLSLLDLLEVGKPGVAAIVANGADGSRYEAARGARYDADHFEAVQYKTAHDEVVRRRVNERAHDPALPDFDGQIAHLTSIALHKAGVLQYQSALAGERATQWNRYRPVLGMVTEGVAAAVGVRAGAAAR
jgi:hypothetical protein